MITAEVPEFKCPKCKGELRFDIHDRKHHCKDCGAMWTMEFDTEKRELVFREWAYAEKGTVFFYGLSAMLKDMEEKS